MSVRGTVLAGEQLRVNENSKTLECKARSGPSTHFRQYLDGLLIKPRPVMEALDEAMGVLFVYTEFHEVGLNLFLKFCDGKLTFEEEQMLRALGVKF